MTYVVLPPASREARLAAATTRWEAIASSRPDLRQAVILQQSLFRTLLDLSDAVESGRLPRLSLPPKYLSAKLARGVPALSAEPIPLPVPILKPFLLRLCQELESGGAGESAAHISAAIEQSRLDAGSLLGASLARDHRSILTGASHMGLAPDLVWLVAELTVSPFAHALQRAVLPRPDAGGRFSFDLEDWTRGYCPVCGSWPALGEVLGGQRILRCSFCSAGWAPVATGCAYCAMSGSDFESASTGPAPHDRHLELCRGCSGYLKTVEVANLSPFPLLAISDLETMDLDLIAIEQGFRRPPLRELKADGTSCH